MALKKALPDMNLALKIKYRTIIWPSSIITGRELALKYHYQTTRTDSVFNPDVEKIIPEYITMLLCASMYSDLGSAERLGFV